MAWGGIIPGPGQLLRFGCLLHKQRNDKNMSNKKKNNKNGGQRSRAREAARARNEARFWFGADHIGFGSGDRPKAMGGRNTDSEPVVIPRKKEQVVEEDEVISVVTGDSGFASESWQIQPGQVGTFPWLSRIGVLYERYRFEYLEVYYKPMVSGYSTEGQTGKVVIAADYDAAGSPPSILREAETMDPHVDGMPYQEMHLSLATARLTPPGGLFVRPGNLPAGTDVKTYDAGRIYFCAAGTNSSATVGELRVRYKVRFFNPRLPESVPVIANHIWTHASNLVVATTSGAHTVIPFSSGNFNPNGLNLSVTAGVFTLPAGILKFALTWSFNHTGGTAPTVVKVHQYYNGVQITNNWTGQHQSGINGTGHTMYYERQAAEGDTIEWRYEVGGGGSPVGALEAFLNVNV